MSADFRRILAGLLATSPMLLPGCRKPPPAVAPTQAAPKTAPQPSAVVAVAEAEAEPGKDSALPRVRSARFIDPRHVQLSFTEPLAPTDAVNPRQFRISSSYMKSETDGYAYATYSDLAYADGEDAEPVVVKKLKRYSDERLLGLELSQPVPDEICLELLELQKDQEEAMAYYDQAGEVEPGPQIQAGLFLHYTERGSAGVKDLSGNELEPFGGAWALNFGTLYQNHSGKTPVARLDLLVPLPCFAVDEYDEGGEATYGTGYAPPPPPPMPVRAGGTKSKPQKSAGPKP